MRTYLLHSSGSDLNLLATILVVCATYAQHGSAFLVPSFLGAPSLPLCDENRAEESLPLTLRLLFQNHRLKYHITRRTWTLAGQRTMGSMTYCLVYCLPTAVMTQLIDILAIKSEGYVCAITHNTLVIILPSKSRKYLIPASRVGACGLLFV